VALEATGPCAGADCRDDLVAPVERRAYDM
jgi:hypothetical protein